jgi:hypothetical protein
MSEYTVTTTSSSSSNNNAYTQRQADEETHSQYESV